MTQTAKRPRRPLQFSRQEIVLITLTVFWGATFLIIHAALRSCGPFAFVGVRFLAAGAASLVLFRDGLRGLTRHELKAGVIVGIAVFLGYGLQTVGLKTISSSQSAFLTALYVPMVPLLQGLLLRRRPPLFSLIGVAMAFAGLLFVTGAKVEGMALNGGEAATLLGAVAIAAQILLVGAYTRSVDSRRFTILQLLVCSLLSFVAMPLAGEALPAFGWYWVAAALGLGLATALIQLAINWAQKTISPVRATVIYTGEPVWAGLFGRLAGDPQPAGALIGAGLIVGGVLVSRVRAFWFFRKREYRRTVDKGALPKR